MANQTNQKIEQQIDLNEDMEEFIQIVIEKLNKKHLLIIGNNETERSELITQIIQQTNFETFRFPKNMKSIDEYIEFVRTKKLYEPWYSKKGKFGSNQILDFHRDWISDNHSLVILEEIENMEERWKLDLLKPYLNEVATRKKRQKVIHLILSQESENNLLQNLEEEIWIPENDNRSKKQIIEGSLEIIEIK